MEQILEFTKELLLKLENLFVSFPVTQDFLITFMSIIFGGVITILINKSSMRKQTFFELQYTKLLEIYEFVKESANDFEAFEIRLSFSTQNINLKDDKEFMILEQNVLSLNKIFREERKILHKYLSGEMLEKSAKITGQFGSLFLESKGTLSDLKHKEYFDKKDIEKLRQISEDLVSLKSQINDSFEKHLHPGLVSAIFRKIRGAKIFIGNLIGIYKVSKKR